MKVVITSYPVMSKFDSQNHTFLKTYWSAEGMGWIFMQPANYIESTAATENLLKIGEYKFDITKHGVRLQPIAFGSRSCDDVERNFHSFKGEGATG